MMDQQIRAKSLEEHTSSIDTHKHTQEKNIQVGWIHVNNIYIRSKGLFRLT